MATYFLVQVVKITDPPTYIRYAQKARPIIESYGGKYLFRSDSVKTLSGQPAPARMALIRFPDAQTINKCFASSEYKAIAHLRESSAETEAFIIEEN